MYSKNVCLGDNLFIYSSVNDGFRLIQGGRYEHGFMSGFFASLSGSGVGMIKTAPIGLYAIVGAATGGTAEALGGGKFANGAITGAFVGLFNHGWHALLNQMANSTGTEVSVYIEINMDTCEERYFAPKQKGILVIYGGELDWRNQAEWECLFTIMIITQALFMSFMV